MADNPFSFSPPSRSSSSSSSNPFTFAPPKPKAPKKAAPKKGGGGILGNLFRDVRDMIVGLPDGVKTIFTQSPVKTARAIYDDYRHMYGPLFRGEFGEFWQNVEEHPLGPILDAFSVATLGAGAVARGGKTLAGAGVISPTSRLARLAEPIDLTVRMGGDTQVVRRSSSNPLIRARQKKINDLLGMLPEHGRINTRRYEKAVMQPIRASSTRLRLRNRPYERAFAGLSNTERVVFHLKAKGTSPEAYATLLRKERAAGGVIDEDTLALLESPKVREAFRTADGNKKLQRALTSARNTALDDLEVLIKNGVIDVEDAITTPFVLQALTEGARFVSKAGLRSEIAKAKRALKDPTRSRNKSKNRAERLQTYGTPELNRTLSAIGKTDKQIAKFSRQVQNRRGLAARYRGRREEVARQLGEVRAELKDIEELYRVFGAERDRIWRGDFIYPDEISFALKKTAKGELKDEPPMEIIGRALANFDSRRRTLERRILSLNATLSNLTLRHRTLAALEKGVDISTEDLRRVLGKRSSLGLKAGRLKDALDDDLARELDNLEKLQKEVDELLAERDRLVKLDPGWFRVEAGALREVDLVPRELREAVERGVSAPELLELMRKTEYPIYLPDAMVAKIRSSGWQTEVNKGLLALAGKVALGENVLGAKFISDVRTQTTVSMQRALEKAATSVPKVTTGQQLPKGYVFLKNVGHETLHHDAFKQALQDKLDDALDDVKQPTGDEWANAHVTTNSAEAATTKTGELLIVPERLVKQMKGEWRNAGKFWSAWLEKPMLLWRMLVLGWRPAFLVNNLVGNHFLYALAFAGPTGIRMWLDQMRRRKGEEWVRGALGNAYNESPTVAHMFMEEFFPEHTELGTFAQAAIPELDELRLKVRGKTVGKASKAWLKKIGFGIMPITQAASEGFLRRAAIETLIRKDPLVRKMYKRMPKDTREWHVAAMKAFEQDPGLQAAISKQLMDAMGDYFSMGPVERHHIRTLLPFYSWYKAITTIALRLPLDHPLKTELLFWTGMIGIEQVREGHGMLPSWMLGLVDLTPEQVEGIPFMDAIPGREAIIGTAGINPMQTLVDLGEATAGLLGAQGRGTDEFLSVSNPFLAAIAETATGQNVLSGAQSDNKLGGLPGVLESVIRDLPQVRVATAPGEAEKDTLYDNTWQRLLWNYLGIPVRQYNPETAKKIAERG